MVSDSYYLCKINNTKENEFKTWLDVLIIVQLNLDDN